MLTAQDLQSLEPGDAVEADPVFKGLSAEPLVLKVRVHDMDKKSVTFDALYYGISIGEWKASYDKELVLWQTA